MWNRKPQQVAKISCENGGMKVKRYRLRWESIAFPNMGLTEIVEAETAKDAKVKAEKNSTDEFLSVYYLDEIEEVPECVVNI